MIDSTLQSHQEKRPIQMGDNTRGGLSEHKATRKEYTPLQTD